MSTFGKSYPRYNLFSVNAPSDGVVIGASESVYGLGTQARVNFVNPGSAQAAMFYRSVINPGPWTRIGEISTNSESFRMLLASHLEYQFQILASGSQPASVFLERLVATSLSGTSGQKAYEDYDYSDGFPAAGGGTPAAAAGVFILHRDNQNAPLPVGTLPSGLPAGDANDKVIAYFRDSVATYNHNGTAWSEAGRSTLGGTAGGILHLLNSVGVSPTYPESPALAEVQAAFSGNSGDTVVYSTPLGQRREYIADITGTLHRTDSNHPPRYTSMPPVDQFAAGDDIEVLLSGALTAWQLNTAGDSWVQLDYVGTSSGGPGAETDTLQSVLVRGNQALLDAIWQSHSVGPVLTTPNGTRRRVRCSNTGVLETVIV